MDEIEALDRGMFYLRIRKVPPKTNSPLVDFETRSSSAHG